MALITLKHILWKIGEIRPLFPLKILRWKMIKYFKQKLRRQSRRSEIQVDSK